VAVQAVLQVAAQVAAKAAVQMAVQVALQVVMSSAAAASRTRKAGGHVITFLKQCSWADAGMHINPSRCTAAAPHYDIDSFI
jgi:hypothetical protein